MSFPLCLILLFIFTAGAFCIGYHCGFQKADQCAFDEGYEFALSDNEVGWRLTASGEAALDAVEKREPLAELELHKGKRRSLFAKPSNPSLNS